MKQAVQHLERFDPRGKGGTLIDTEHRARYWWASHGVTGKNVLDAGCGVGYGIGILASGGAAGVTGVDIDPSAVSEAEDRFGASAEEIVVGDLLDLPLDDDSFDVAVCFETIEHIEDGGQALAELRRVLRPDGLLLISSPNPDVYPAGNEHHVHEYRPAELAAAVGEHFGRVECYCQHASLASVIEPAADGGPELDEPDGSSDSRRTASFEPGRETYGIVAATDAGALPELAETVMLGDAFEVGWWSRQVENSKAEGERVAQDARRQIEIAREEAHAHIAQVEGNAQSAIARSTERERAAEARLRESADALLDANRELVQLPLLQHRLAVLEEEHLRVCGLYSELCESRSWRLSAPLRRLRRLFAARD